MKAILVGFGFLGKRLLEALTQKKFLKKTVRITGVSQSDGYVYDATGLDPQTLLSLKRVSEYPSDFHDQSSVELIQDCDADLLIEVTPTNVIDGEPGLTHIETALKKGMHVVTANKGPMVVAFNRLVALAENRDVDLKYEGTVAGAVPIFSLVEHCLQGNQIRRISGILNGTANFILSKMYFEGTTFDLALKEAQERGYAETDPSYDVEGIDAACKVVILANALMGRSVQYTDVKRVGIQRITPEAVSLAKRSGYAIKLIGTIDRQIEVTPTLIPETHPLCVHGTLNALHLELDLAREITLIGYGAGRETVSSIVNDIISVVQRTT